MVKHTTEQTQNNNSKLTLILIGLMGAIPTFLGFSQFPKFLGDEGIYTSQAWWLINFGKLGPYTYWYDHSPLGWLQIGIWQKLTGGPFTFGFSLVSTRMMMVLLTGLSAVLLYKLVQKLTKSTPIALISLILWGLSPLCVLFHRQVLLDNIAAFWLLASLLTFFHKPKSGKWIFISSILLSVAILSKESLLFFLPAYLISILIFNKNNNRYYLLLLGTITCIFILGLFPLFSLLKGEFLPGLGHVSFLQTVLLQAKRGAIYWFWQPQSDLMAKLNNWLVIDPWLIIVGLGSLILNLFQIKDKHVLSLQLLSWSFILFFIRKGVILDFYIIPLLPLLVLQICLLIHFLITELKVKNTINRQIWILLLPACLLVLFLIKTSLYLYTTDATANQLAAIKRLMKISDKNAVIVADNFAFLDLRFNENGTDNIKNIHWYTKAESDPEIRNIFLRDNPNNIDYLLVNSTMGQEIDLGQTPFLQKARGGMQQIADFNFVTASPFPIGKHPSYLTEDLKLFQRTKTNQFGKLTEINK